MIEICKYDNSIQEFLKSEDRVLIISGNTMSGKTVMIPKIKELANKLNYIEVSVFAYSNRLKNKMLRNHPEIQEINSLYNEIFDFENEEVDENYKKIIPTKVIYETEIENNSERKLFIIDDSQLISNSNLDSETLRFGSGYLLDDLFSYLQLSKYPNRKIIFIGDTNRISYGSNVENAMNADYLSSYLETKGISNKIHTLILPPRTDSSEIINVCNKIAENINLGKYNELIINKNKDIVLYDSKEQLDMFEELYKAPNYNKMLVYTNEQANKINLSIKNKLTSNASSIGVGDTIVFNSTIEAYKIENSINEDMDLEIDKKHEDDNNLTRIDNGSLATVVAVDFKNSITKEVSINGKLIKLIFIPCQVKLLNTGIFQIYVFDNYLKSSKAELETTEKIAYQMILSHLFDDCMLDYNFEDSDEFKKMKRKNEEFIEKTGKPYFKLNSKGDYRLEVDARMLPQEIKEFKKRIEKELRDNPSSDYFKIYNAARVKYAWAMTVNKAIAYTFDNIYFNTSQGENRGRTNKEYFKWLYTGFATAESSIKLINWVPISPFMNTAFNSVASGSVQKPKNYIFVFSNNDKTKDLEFENFIGKSLAQTDWIVLDILPRPYLEIVKLKKDEKSLELFFDYNGKGEVKLPRLKSGEKEDLEEIVGIIKNYINDNIEVKIDEVKITEDLKHMDEYIGVLINLLNSNNINTTIKNTQKWGFYFKFSNENENVEVQCWYDSQGMISKFNRISGSKELFDEITMRIKETYSIFS